MVPDVMPISGTTAKYAVRLCNFKTGQSTLTYNHRQDMELKVKPLIAGSSTCYAEIVGYASHKGDARNYDNRSLSMSRIAAVKSLLLAWQPQLRVTKTDPEGSSASTGGVENDDGYWRAVDVFIYCTGQAPATPHPSAPQLGRNWRIRVISGQIGGVTVPLVDTGVGGLRIVLEIVDLDRKKKAQFRAFSGGFQLPTASVVPNPIPLQVDESQILPGTFTNFTTREFATLEDFQGSIDVNQDPALNTHRVSGGGNFSLVFNHLPEIGNSTVPRIVSVNTGNPILMNPKAGGGMASAAGTIKLITFPQDIP
jgi:hypothetical protein